MGSCSDYFCLGFGLILNLWLVMPYHYMFSCFQQAIGLNPALSAFVSPSEAVPLISGAKAYSLACYRHLKVCFLDLLSILLYTRFLLLFVWLDLLCYWTLTCCLRGLALHSYASTFPFKSQL